MASAVSKERIISNRKIYYIFLLIILLVSGLFRTVGLTNRRVNGDEEHYRGNSSYSLAMLARGDIKAIRNHSYQHEEGRAPHGMVYPLVSRTIGFIAYRLTEDWAPETQYERDNLYSRLCNVLVGIFLCWFVFYFSYQLFGDLFSSFSVGMIAALSPIQINWSRGEYLDPVMTFFLVLSFYFVWLGQKILATREKALSGLKAYFFLILAGIFAGTAAGTKWAAFPVLPVLIFSFVFPQVVSLSSGGWRSRDTLVYKSFFVLLFAVLLGFFMWHSFASLESVFFPDASDKFGDSAYEDSFLGRIIGNSIGVFRDSNNYPGFFLLWGGPIFAFLCLYALVVKSKRIFVGGFKLHWQSNFLIIFLFSALFSFSLNDGHLYNWRCFYPMIVIFILMAKFLSEITIRNRIKLAVLVFLFEIPFSINHGLRIGYQFPDYFGKSSTYFETSREMPEYPIYLPR